MREMVFADTRAPRSRMRPLLVAAALGVLASCASSRPSAPTAEATPVVPVATGAGVAAKPVVVEVAPTVVAVVPSDRQAPKPAEPAASKPLSPEIARQLATVDPERVFQTAEAKPGVPALTIIGPSEQRIQALGSVELKVQAAPNAPVTFATADGGVFANQAASITVLADEAGIAKAVMHAPNGTVDDVPVTIGSPAASGTVTAIVHVLYPGSPLANSPVSNQ